MVEFIPLKDEEKKRLFAALTANAENKKVILMDRKDTTFQGVSDEIPDDEVVGAIKSVPTHYAL